MKTIAIIAEYNPFHNGHLYMLNKAKELTGADYSIALTSGNFTQRGTPAICDKFTRAYMAVLSGIDLCLELPYVYSTGSAYDFASGAVSLLDKLNSVDYLCFGAENDDMDLFNIITDIIIDEPEEYLNILKSEQKCGLSYPSARQKALTGYIEASSEGIIKSNISGITEIISKPNNILAIEYLCALKRINSKIKPVLIKREIADYKDENINGSISSAYAIRKAISEVSVCSTKDTQKKDLEIRLKNDMPQDALCYFMEMYNKEYPLSPSSIMPFIQAACMNFSSKKEICDLNNSLLNKLKKVDLCINYEDLIKALKSKDITETRINRALLHLVTGYEEKDRDSFYKYGTAFYASILSFRKSSSELIKRINEGSLIPVITKKSDFDKIISANSDSGYAIAKRMWNLDIAASELYRKLLFNTLETYIDNDFKTNIPIFDN